MRYPWCRSILVSFYRTFLLIVLNRLDSVMASGGPFDIRPGDLTWTSPPEELVTALQSKRYNRNIAPGQLTNDTTDVKVGFYIESMSSFRAHSMDFEVDMYLAYMWKDPRLENTSLLPTLVNDVRIAQMMWQPDLYFSNSKHASVHTVTSLNFMMLIYPDGLVFKSIRVASTLSCVMDFARYPLYTQSCPIYIQSYAYVEHIVNVSWFVDNLKNFPISYNRNIRLNDMILIGRSHSTCSYWYEMLKGRGYWSCLSAVLTMKRQLLYHLLQTYFPTSMLVCISWLTFWLDIRASPARVGLAITTLLTLTSVGFSVRGGLPQVNYIKAIDVWLSLCTAFVFSVLLEFTVVNLFIGRQNKNCIKHVASVYDRLQNGKIKSKMMKHCSVCAEHDEDVAYRIDKASRIMFPVAFLSCSFMYWTYYLFTD